MTSDPDTAGERSGWQWDPTLYAGSAAHYSSGRVAYPAELAAALVRELDLDGSGRLLDVGCGPGSLTLLLAPHFAEAIGVDADADMLAEAARLAAQRGLSNLTWRHLRAEDLPADLPSVRVVLFAQSFHWMDQERVAGTVRTMLDDGGAAVHAHASTHQGIDTDADLPHPQPPWAAVTELVQAYLGERRRAGQGFAPAGKPGREDEIYPGAGFTGRVRIEIPERLVTRTIDDIASSVYSLSSSTPYLFGDRLPAFDSELRNLLAASAPDGLFSEQMRSIAADVWR